MGRQLLNRKDKGIIQEESPVQGDGNCLTRKLQASYRKKARYRGTAIALQENYGNHTERKPSTGGWQLPYKKITGIVQAESLILGGNCQKKILQGYGYSGKIRTVVCNPSQFLVFAE